MAARPHVISIACVVALGLVAPTLMATAASPVEAQSDMVLVTDFEDGTTQGWAARGPDEQVEVTDADAHGGALSLLTTGRTSAWNGPRLDILDVTEVGRAYDLSVWLRLAPGAEPADLRLSIQRDAGGESSFDTVVGNTSVGADEWVHFTGSYTLTGDVDGLSVYAESASALVDFFLDDFEMMLADQPPIQTDIPSLHEELADHFPLGTAIDQRELTGRPAELLTKHFNSITAENDMKWESIEPVEGEFTFDVADTLVDFAVEHDMRVWGHTLVWHNQTPDWVFEDADGEPLTDSPEHKALLLQRMENHIRAKAGRYGDRIQAWDVVNEVIDENQPDGLRRSRWYEIAGLDYIRRAFEVAREVAPNAELYINDYNTEFPDKREAMFALVERLRDEGVPIDGVGHQFHIGITRPLQLVDDTIVRFSELGVAQAVTELDVGISLFSDEELPEVPQDRLITQGYYFRDLFDILRRHSDDLTSVSVWGLYDARSWLRTWPFERMEAPLFFDDDLQAKPAYWGVVDPSELPHLPVSQDTPEGRVRIDGERETQWNLLPDRALTSTGSDSPVEAAFQTRWSGEHLYALVDVVDPTDDGAADVVEFFVADRRFSVRRDGQVEGPAAARNVLAKVAPTDTGYRVEARNRSTIGRPGPGDRIDFDLRVTDGGAPQSPISWSDQSHRQEDDTSRWGTLELTEPVAVAHVPRAGREPVIDGEIDPIWDRAARVTTDVQVVGIGGATADVHLLWDSDRLYVLAEVTDPELDESHPDPWEQDSIEIFVDPSNGKRPFYESDVGQYRVGFTNRQSIGGGDLDVIGDNLTSATSITDDGYVVEASVELGTIEPVAGSLLGFEFQVNDAIGGGRTAVRTWHDPTGQSWQNTSRWGVIQLTG